MLPRIRELAEKYNTPEKFLKRVTLYFQKESIAFKLIEKACLAMWRDFELKGMTRDGGGSYATHPLAVAVICLEYLHIRDAEDIIAALLHDNVEDLKALGWTHEYIQCTYGVVVAELVWWNTKPELSLFEGNTEMRDAVYHEQLRHAPLRAIRIKLADRLHNIMTLCAHSVQRQQRKLTETLQHYLPLTEKHQILRHELVFAMKEAKLLLPCEL